MVDEFDFMEGQDELEGAFNTYETLYEETAAASDDVRISFAEYYGELRGYVPRMECKGSEKSMREADMDEAIQREKGLALATKDQVTRLVQ